MAKIIKECGRSAVLSIFLTANKTRLAEDSWFNPHSVWNDILNKLGLSRKRQKGRHNLYNLWHRNHLHIRTEVTHREKLITKSKLKLRTRYRRTRRRLRTPRRLNSSESIQTLYGRPRVGRSDGYGHIIETEENVGDGDEMQNEENVGDGDEMPNETILHRNHLNIRTTVTHREKLRTKSKFKLRTP
jgi:hypothetical protein